MVIRNPFRIFIDIFSGRINGYPSVTLLKFFYRCKAKKKNPLRMARELWILTRHWKAFPYQYLEYEMFLDCCPFTINEMKNYVSEKGSIDQFAKANKRYLWLCKDKAISYDLMNYSDIPHPNTFLKYSNGNFYDTRNHRLDEKQVNGLINQQRYKKIIVKYNYGSYGKLIYAYQKDADGSYHCNGDILSASHIKQKFKDIPVILQEGIVQNELLSSINPDSVNSIRVLTKNIRNDIKMIDATVKFGRKGSIVDNASSGGLLVNIDIDTGKFGDFGKAYFDINNYYEHPDSRIVFKGLYIEKWDDVRQLVKKAASIFHQLIYIGWDVAITKDGPVILEMNGTPSMYTQITSGGLAERVAFQSKKSKG